MINILRDTEGHPTRVMLNVDNVFVPIPIDVNSLLINWESIKYEPTRESIKTAWDNWAIDKDLLIELADRPDLAPILPDANPDWGKFKRDFLSSSTVYKIATQSSNQYAVDNFRAILTPLGYNDLAAEDYPTLQTVWGYIISGLSQQPTEEMIAELNAIALAANMIYSFDSEGKIEIPSN